MGEGNDRPPDGASVGNMLAVDLVKQIVILNESMERNRELFEGIAESLAELAGYHEVFQRACELVVERVEDGSKSKWTIADFADCVVEAADEIMPPDDEPGDEDPLIEKRR